MPWHTIPRNMDYTFVKSLGNTIYGQIFLATPSDEKNLVVVKVTNLKRFNKYKLELMENPVEEIRILKALNHPGIIRHYKHHLSSTHLFHVMEHFPGQDLYDFTQSATQIAESTARAVFRQLIHVVQYLHTNNVVHGDISPENILIDTKTHAIKLIDFGASSVLQPDGPQRIPCDRKKGKLNYMSPEIFEGQDHDPKAADLYSCGVVLFVMLFRAQPYARPAAGVDKLFDAVMAKKYHAIHLGRKVSKDAMNLMHGLIAPEATRLTLPEIMKHPWFVCQETTSEQPTGDRLSNDQPLCTDSFSRKRQVSI